MNRLKVSCSVCALVLFMTACSKNEPGGSNKNGSPGTERSATPEAPAALQPANKSFYYNFDGDVIGQTPAKFHEALTGPGAKAQWVIEAPSAPSQPNVLAHTSMICGLPQDRLLTGAVRAQRGLRHRAVSDQEDQLCIRCLELIVQQS